MLEANMPFYGLRDRVPRVHATAYVHPLAVVLGDVHIFERCYIGPCAVLRADWGGIRIGKGSNIQENCVVHVRPQEVARLGEDCHVGHGAIIHGAMIEDRVLVGMGAILFDGVRVGADAIVGAGSVLPEGFVVPPRAVVGGVPARILKEASDDLLERKRRGTVLYQSLPGLYGKHLREIPPEEVTPPA
jgi:phenylacetic acid degradation protein